MNKRKINGIIISARKSGRMKMFKPLIGYRGNSFIRNITLKLNSICDKIIVVTGYSASEVKENIKQLNINSKNKFVPNTTSNSF